MRALAWILASMLFLPALARAQDDLAIDEVLLDPPTVISLGVQVLITGDDDHDARIDVRIREEGGAYRDAMPLYRVRPEVSDMTVPEQFAGSLMELDPATTYEIELHAIDPDGLDETRTITGTTRPVPADPTTPRAVPVNDEASLRAALSGATAGDVITLAAGTYAGQFSISASGTEAQPIVIRGADRDSVILDGEGCDGCNVIEIYGSHVHVESLTIEAATRGLRFQGADTVGNVVRRVRIRDVQLGIGSRSGQRDFYVCDNELSGRLAWPAIYRDDGGAHSNDDGIRLEGSGHVVCHNRIVGFGDTIKIQTDLTRGIDFYGNEVLSAYDNAMELDGMSGGGRIFRNRVTNTYAPLSVQPIYGGPVYLVRNVVVNVADEQIKWHGVGSGEGPSGVLVFHNTFVTAGHAIQTSTSATSHFFVVQNNLWIGDGTDGQVIVWDAPIDQGVLDYDGYAPDGEMFFRGARFPSFAAMQADGRYEANGTLLTGAIFESGLAPPADYTTAMAPPDATLASASGAIDRGLAIRGIAYEGAAPDLGALERGCPVPIYGIRPPGIDETNEPRGCGSDPGPGVDGGVSLDGGGTPIDGGPSSGADAARADGGAAPAAGGCGCRAAGAPPRSLTAVALVVAALAARRRERAL